MINYDDSRRDITIETTPGPRTQSRLIIREPQIADSGNYTCNFYFLYACYIFVMQTKKDMKTLSSIHYLTFFVCFVCLQVQLAIQSQQAFTCSYQKVRLCHYIIWVSPFSYYGFYLHGNFFWGKEIQKKNRKKDFVGTLKYVYIRRANVIHTFSTFIKIYHTPWITLLRL